MSLRFTDVSDGIATIKLSGKLTTRELSSYYEDVPGLLAKHGDFNLLVLATEFEGFGPGDWGSSSPQTQHDNQIRRIGVVCDPSWATLAIMFAGKGLRPAEVEWFPPSRLEEARAWLGERPNV